MISRSSRTTTLTCATLLALGVATALASAGCKGGGDAPEIDDPGMQIAQVGTQLSLTLLANDPDGDAIAFGFDSNIPEIESRAMLTRSPSGAGIFRWTPLAADVGTWFVDFTASDGDNTTTLTVEIDVRSAIGGSGTPVFRAPLGTGTTLDLEEADCLDVEIVIEDQDSTSVVIAQEEPVIEGATIEASGGLEGTWRWCPNADQIAADAEDRYTLTLSADDLANPVTLKDYLIVLRKPNRPDCPGLAPVIDHTAADESTVNNLTVSADISDDEGLKQPPLFYYSLTDPGANPNLGAMTQLTMLLVSGSMQDGVWAADVPNPVAGMTTGSMRDVYYVIVADDDDDDMGDCDHTTESSVYAMTVTNPGGSGNTGLCESCTTDAQCGGDGDLCVRVGVMNQPYCLDACTGAADCATGYTCSASPVTSVNGASARQCVPNSGSCTAGGGCTDDLWEDNDTRAQAAANPALPANDIFDLTSCPLATGTGDDEDFFELDITADATITLEITGEAVTDLDLALTSSTGANLQTSTSLTSSETITRCLTPGLYYARVYAFGTGENDYLLSYDVSPGSCALACNEDSFEDDDSTSEARFTSFPTHTATGQTICTDDDWYAVSLLNSEVLTVSLTFTQTTSQQDLDLHFHNAAGTDLTPCTEANPATCTTAQGQSANSNEAYTFTAPSTGCTSGCDYYVRVHGWAGSKNTYAISIAVQ